MALSLPRASLRSYLVVLTASVVIPMLGFAVYLAMGLSRAQQEAVERGLFETVQALASKANLPPADVKRYLDVIHRSLEVRSHEGRCRTCGNQRPVFSFSRLE
jgi:hypothetical protein